jgi:hypothetical protein
VREHGCQLTVVGGVRESGRAAILVLFSEIVILRMVSQMLFLMQCNDGLEAWKWI